MADGMSEEYAPFTPPDLTWFAGKHILVIGLARSGYAAIRLLSRLGAQPIVADQKTRAQLEDMISLYGLPAWPCFFGTDPLPLLKDVDGVIISPAVPMNAPVVIRAQEMGVPLIGELELGALSVRGPITAITGTNGKTTTVTLLGCMLTQCGRPNHVCGNVGYPISHAVLDAQPGDDLLVEVSSFQLETVSSFHPRVAVLLNITPDHLNRHGSMDVYTRLKYRVFAQQTGQDIAVLNYDDPLCRGAQAKTRATVRWISTQEEVADGAYLSHEMLWLSHGGRKQAICAARDVLIPGRHNVMNALAASAVADALGVPISAIAAALRTFPGVEHRIEFVLETGGIRYLNDSKGTNPESTMRAVEAMDRPTVILLGGQDKGTPFEALAACIAQSPQIQHAVLIGETATAIAQSLTKQGFTKYTFAETIKAAVLEASHQLSSGGTVLLSPACASFDMFKDYEQRGRQFKDIVNSLAAGLAP